MNYRTVRRLFWVLNRFFMVPAFRLGLGPLMGNPVTGYIMVLRTVGRNSGRVRRTPVNYAILNGHVYCIAGWGQVADWYRNLQVRPLVELILPGGPLAGLAETVTDPEESLSAMRQVLRNAGFAGFFLGFNPLTASDEVLRQRTSGIPVVRIRHTGVGSGAGDPGGWAWVGLAAALAVILWLLLTRT